MINFVVDLLLALNNLLFDNLGLTIIVIGVLSRVLIHPFVKSSLSYSKKMRDLKPKLDELKRKHGKDRTKLLQEQSILYQKEGINPATGCIGPLVQLGLVFVLYLSLQQLLKEGVNTNFLIWDLAKFDTWRLESIPFALPGILVLLTAVTSLITAKMALPEPVPTYEEDPKIEKKEKADFADALAASQGQLVYLFPLFLLIWGGVLPAGVFLFWFVNGLVGAIQQYYIAGLGGLKSWPIFKNLK